jgi:hypothetical protein
MIGGIGQHTRDHPALFGHAHALLSTERFDVGLLRGHTILDAARS